MSIKTISTEELIDVLLSLSNKCVSVSLLGINNVRLVFENCIFYFSDDYKYIGFGNITDENSVLDIDLDKILTIKRDCSNINLDLGESLYLQIPNGDIVTIECCF